MLLRIVEEVSLKHGTGGSCRGIDYILAVAGMYGVKVQNLPSGVHAVCEHRSCNTAAQALDLTTLNCQKLSPLLAMQAIVVPVNNWLEPNVGDGKQEVRQHPVYLLTGCP